MSRLILGLNTDHGDSSAVLVGDRGIVAGVSEERINRQKHSAAFPALAIREVLRMGGVELRDVTDVAVARDPTANLAAKIRFAARRPRGAFHAARRRIAVHSAVRSMPARITSGLDLRSGDLQARLHQVEHHLAHVASAFYWSPFDSCLALSVDGAGDFATSMVARGEGLDVTVVKRSFWPHSLGVFYSALTQFLGFDRYGEEYKVMGLSAYGKDTLQDRMRELVRHDERRGLRLNLKYFTHHRGSSGFEEIRDGEVRLPRLWADSMAGLLGPPRGRDAELSDRDRDLAASMQRRYEDVFLDLVDCAVRALGRRDIVCAGGCALNSVANGRMLSEGHVDRAYFQPAASDDGTALGAALYVLHAVHRAPRGGEVRTASWGPEWTEAEIEAELRRRGIPHDRLSSDALIEKTAQALAAGEIVGWFQGREEWGPRALGHRSILCNPGWPEMKAILNARIKNREAFRPFAPVVQREDLERVFEGRHEVPFMVVVYQIRREWRDRLPAITHADGTGRVQTVRRVDNPLFYDLIGAFKKHTGLPALLNTSFNENEPIVHTPRQAVDCFQRTKMDCLAIGGSWLAKQNQV
jgi:carbamoyltransferase